MRSIHHPNLLTAAEEKALGKRKDKGDEEARRILIERNIPLVVSICQKYARAGFDLEDLVQEGIIGLTRAVDKFDQRKGFKLSTYATWWIKKVVHTYMNQDGGPVIKVPGRVRKVQNDVRKRIAKHGGTPEEAAIALGIEPEELAAAFTGPRIAVPLDEPRGRDGEGAPLHETIADPHAGDPADEVSRTGPAIDAALNRLEPLQRQILELRLGLSGEGVMGRNDVADRLKVPRKVVQREQKAAIDALRRYLVIEEAERRDEDPVAAVLTDLDRGELPDRCERKPDGKLRSRDAVA